MKTILTLAMAGVLSIPLVALGQNQAATSDETMGRGRGGAPFAWNDTDKDGICDVTGQPVGQAIGQGGRFMAGRRGARRGMAAGAWGRGAGRGMGRAFWAGQQQTPAQQPQN